VTSGSDHSGPREMGTNKGPSGKYQ
jgi:hypothetical protein